jgi:hypothetical protein
VRRSLVLLFLLSACTSADVLRVDRTPRPVVADRKVPILLDEPTQPYSSIALIEVSGSWASLERLGRRLSAEAAKLGGDAVLLTRRSAHSGSSVMPAGETFISVDTNDSRLIGKVIVYSTTAGPPRR